MELAQYILLVLYFQFSQDLTYAQAEDVSPPLYLSPLIKEGKIDEARNLSRVNIEGFDSFEGYTGYITVDGRHNSNLFFFFVPSQSDRTKDPVVLFLQGGPGASGCIGFFGFIGPFRVTPNLTLETAEYSWNRNHSMIYLDHPVGTGYSFTDPGTYPQNETVIGEQLYVFLIQFFQMFPELQDNEFFVDGEAYAGKFAVAISHIIHERNVDARQKINLKGLAIGNGLIDPEHQQLFGTFLYNIGLIDEKQMQLVTEDERHRVKLIQYQEWIEAFTSYDNFIRGTFNNNTMFNQLTGYQNYFNYLFPVDPTNFFADIFKFSGLPIMKQVGHVGNKSFVTDSTVVVTNLMSDFMQSVAPWLSELACYYRVLIYTGNLDIEMNHVSVSNYLNHLNFSGKDEFEATSKQLWHVGGRLAGYYKKGGNLTNVVVLNAGHFVPMDQPEAAFDLITRFTRNQSLN